MKKLFYLIAMALTTLLAMAQFVDVSVYDDCGMNGYTKVIKPRTGTATVLSTSGRTSCEWVQLWENGPKWATFNVGATITNYANLSTDTDPTIGNDASFNTANVGGLYPFANPTLNGRMTTWEVTVNRRISDVANTLWGSNWKTPTKEQLDTLCDRFCGKTTWTWCDGSTTQYVPGCTLKGYKVSGVGDYANYSIFLPNTGYFNYSSGWGSVDIECDYWSSTYISNWEAYKLSGQSKFHGTLLTDQRYGYAVRAVLIQ